MYLRFHDNCGKKIKLSNNHQTAQRTSRGGFFCPDGMVISRDPMLTDMLYQVSETFSVCLSVSLSLSLSLSLCLSVCLPFCLSVSLSLSLSLPDVHSELRKSWTFSTFILQDTSTTPVARPTGTLRCTGEPVARSWPLVLHKESSQDKSATTVVLRFAGPPCQVASRATRFRRV